MIENIFKFIMFLIRMIFTPLSFGYWMNNYYAGIFMFFLIDLIIYLAGQRDV
jgi:hypothetical protein